MNSTSVLTGTIQRRTATDWVAPGFISSALPLTGVVLTGVDASILGELESPLALYLSTDKITGPGLLEQLEAFCAVPAGQDPENSLPPDQIAAIRHKLADVLLTADERMLAIAQKYLSIPDYLTYFMRRVISTDDGLGKIGTKGIVAAIGLKILAVDPDFRNQYMPIGLPDSHFMTAEDCFSAFMEENREKLQPLLDLFKPEFEKLGLKAEFGNFKYLPFEKVKAHKDEIRDAFVCGTKFPADLERKLRDFVKWAGQGSIVVRSSSLLEDSSDDPFAGIYHTEPIFFGEDENINYERLRAAIALVYSSTFGSEAIRYRQKSKLLDADENMGIILQKMVGEQNGIYFGPQASLVAHTYFDQPWQIDQNPEDGVIFLSAGLGLYTAKVQGKGGPVVVSMSRPSVPFHSWEIGGLRDGAQREVYAVDMQQKKLVSVDPPVWLAGIEDKRPHAEIFSVVREGYAHEGCYGTDGGDPIISFQGLLKLRGFTDQIKSMLAAFKRGFGIDVEVEAAMDRVDEEGVFKLIQIRALQSYEDSGPVEIPTNIQPERVVFYAEGQGIQSKEMPDVDYFIYVDPVRFLEICSDSKLVSRLEETLTRLNVTLEGKSFAVFGPGRWGSGLVNDEMPENDENPNLFNERDKALGIPAHLSAIDNAAVAFELLHARSSTPSGGNHYGLNARKRGLKFIPINLMSSNTIFNTSFFHGDNALVSLLPDYQDMQDLVKVFDARSQFSGSRLQVKCDARSKRAIGHYS